MKNFSYKIEHDFGLAPNPFGGYCTLAVCKSSIRSNKGLEVGSWIIGTGSKKLKNANKLIYAMQVGEKLTFNEYWNDPRFQYKKPIINGTLVQMYGDNFYHQNEEGKWIQENSAHSLANGMPNLGHLKRDVGGQYVLISTNFYYFGDQAISVPKEFVRDVFVMDEICGVLLFLKRLLINLFHGYQRIIILVYCMAIQQVGVPT